VTKDEITAKAMLLGGERYGSLIRMREGPSFDGCAYFTYLQPETMEQVARQSEIDRRVSEMRYLVEE
jgi:hypothetical protein